ncbi:Inner membrane protein YbiR [Raoultella terrigena]|uniref:Inner membrane protein YbiR n=1 Tax=Raoultella terrigena TaxID=577 RepID=A0A485B8K7_RAOTE|nr:Inner membrane protein YbiR [Raoultella terrigena]
MWRFFIVVPLTLTLKKWCAIPVNRLIIFEALAVNAGSLLTPIGNPQNILLWGRSGLSFPAFIGQMLPLAAAMMITLLALCWCCFFSRTPHLSQRRSGALLAAKAGLGLPGAVSGFS